MRLLSKLAIALLAFGLVGCSIAPTADNQPNVVLCLLASCSLQAEESIKGSIEGDSDQIATDTADPTVSLPGG